MGCILPETLSSLVAILREAAIESTLAWTDKNIETTADHDTVKTKCVEPSFTVHPTLWPLASRLNICSWDTSFPSRLHAMLRSCTQELHCRDPSTNTSRLCSRDIHHRDDWIELTKRYLHHIRWSARHGYQVRYDK